MKKLLTILLVLSFTASYSKPLEFITLRYKGKVLDSYRVTDEFKSKLRSPRFKFNKLEIPTTDLLDAISYGFTLHDSEVEYWLYYRRDENYYKIRKLGFEVIEEIHDIK
jgi:hypothetical protein